MLPVDPNVGENAYAIELAVAKLVNYFRPSRYQRDVLANEFQGIFCALELDL